MVAGLLNSRRTRTTSRRSSTGAEMLEIRATLADCQQLVAAICDAGGRVPEPLANLLLRARPC